MVMANMKNKALPLLGVALLLPAVYGVYHLMQPDSPENHSTKPIITATNTGMPAEKAAVLPDGGGITVTDPATGKTVTLKPGEAYSTGFAPDPPSPLSVEEQAKQEEMQTYHDSLLGQDAANLLSQWQVELLNPTDDPEFGSWKLQQLEDVLAVKLRQAAPDDPVYTSLRNLALSSENVWGLKAAGNLLARAATPTSIEIAQAMINKYAGATSMAGDELRREGLNAGYAILQGLFSERSIAGMSGNNASPLPPLGNALQSAWNNVQGTGDAAYAQHLHLANALATEGDATSINFLLQSADAATDQPTRDALYGAMRKVNNPQALPVLGQALGSSSPDSPQFQASSTALAAFPSAEGGKALLQWAQTKATDADAKTVKDWFSQTALFRYDPIPGGQVATVNVIKPLAESGSFQSEAVKTAVLEGIAEQERQLSPQLSQAQ